MAHLYKNWGHGSCSWPQRDAILPSTFRRQKGGYLTESLEMAFVKSGDVGGFVNNHHSRYHRVVNLNAFDRVSRDKTPSLLMFSQAFEEESKVLLDEFGFP
jgi:hypothetical protein